MKFVHKHFYYCAALYFIGFSLFILIENEAKPFQFSIMACMAVCVCLSAKLQADRAELFKKQLDMLRENVFKKD